MRTDTSLWTNGIRMRERIKNLATVIMSLAAMNIFNTMSTKSWIIMGINIFMFLSMIPLWISWSRFQKEPPQEQENGG